MDVYQGEIRIVAFNFAPAGWALCNGQELPIADNEALFELLGTTYGGDGQAVFNLPDLRGRIPVGATIGGGGHPLGQAGGVETVALTQAQLPAHRHALLASPDAQNGESPTDAVLASSASIELYSPYGPEVQLGPQSIRPVGGSQPHDNMQPFLAVNFIISLDGQAPTDPWGAPEPFLAEIRLFAGNAIPTGWASCAGQLLPLSQYTQLFVLLGTNFGGDGRSSFALPDLQDAVPMCFGDGDGLSGRNIGDTGGSETVTLLESEMPSHGHALEATPSPASSGQPSPAVSLAASQGGNAYAEPAGGGLTSLASAALAARGGGVPHNNLQPYLALNYCIAMEGEFPPRG